MATRQKCSSIPRSFSWLLPAQSIVTGVAIYSTVYVFSVGSKPFILAVAAAGIQFVLGLYCCFTASRHGIHHAICVPILLLAIAGVWCGPVYYFGKLADIYIKVQKALPVGTDTPPAATWTYVGLATSILDVILALTLLTLFLVEGLQSPRKPPQHVVPGGYISAPVYGMPPPGGAPYQYQQPQQQQQYQYQQQQPPVMTGISSAPAHVYPSPTPYGDSKFGPAMTSAAVPISPITTPIEAPTNSPSPMAGLHQQGTPYYPYDRTNRIDAIRRLCALQHGDGHWDFTPELADITRQWGGGRELPGYGADALAVTTQVHACLGELCQYVWTAQRERAEESRLSAGEMASFQSVGWDLGFARGSLTRAAGWLGR